MNGPVVGPTVPLRKPCTSAPVTPSSLGTGGVNSVINHHSSPPEVTVNLCNYCSKQGNFRCVRCRKAFYCSIHCQTQDWPAHRRVCWVSTADHSDNNTPESPGLAAKGERDAPLQTQRSVNGDATPQQSSSPQRIYLKDLKAHGITKGTEMKGMVAEFSSPSRFFVLPQDSQVSENMKTIVTELQNSSDEPTTTPYTPSLGEVCTVQFSMDGNWYRGVVLSVSSDQKTATVLYVDFGNEEDVPLDKDLIKPLPVNLQTMPPCVLECCLSGVEPVGGSWTRECCMVVKQVMSGKCLPVSVMDTSENGHVFTVDILLSAFGKNLSTFLLDQGYAAKETKKPSEQDINSLLDAALENYKRRSNGKDGNLGAQPPEPLTLCVGDTFDAVVTNLLSPHDMICQKLDNAVEIYEQQLNLREHCSEIPANHDFRPAPGTMCCSLSSEDKQWYRAKVLAYSSEDHVCVGYIDHGISEEVDLSSLRPISHQLLALPMQAIPCALAGVRPIGEVWSDECLLALSQAVSNRMLRMKVVGKRDATALLSMVDPSSDPQADVAELLLTLRHASPLGTDGQPGADSHAHTNSADPQTGVEATMPIKACTATPPIEACTATPPMEVRTATPPIKAPTSTAPVEAHQASTPVEARCATMPVEEARAVPTPVESPHAEAVPEAKPLLWYCAELPSDGQAVPVMGSLVESPGDFHCYLYNPEDLQKLVSLGAELHQHCEADSATFRPRVGEPCCAKFAGDGAWYRAMVQGVLEDKAEVYFVDYGNSSLVENIHLRTITPELLTLPFQAIRCSLAGVLPVGSEWSSEVILRFQSMMVDLTARVVSVSERGYQVELESSGHSVAASLILDNLAMAPPAAVPSTQNVAPPSTQAVAPPSTQGVAPPSTHAVAPPSTQDVAPPSSQDVAPPSTQNVAPPSTQNVAPPSTQNAAPPSTQNAAPPITQDVAPPITQEVAPPITQDLSQPPGGTSPPGCFPLDWKAAELPLNEIFQPRVAAVISPSLFYLHAPSQIGVEELQQVMGELAVYGTTNQDLGFGQTPAVGAACCARFTGDNNWYRAVVLQVTDSDITVLYADYGNTETLPSSHILPIPPHLLQVPAQIARCALTGQESFPRVWPAKERDMFKTLLSDGVTASVEHRDDSIHLLSVTLSPEMGGGNLNTLMLDALQSPAETPPPTETDHNTPEPQHTDAAACAVSAVSSTTPPVTQIESDQPVSSTVTSAIASGAPAKPELMTNGADGTANAMGSHIEREQLTGSTERTADAPGPVPESTEAAVKNGGVDGPICCCVELKTKIAHLEQLMEMQLSLLTKLEKQVKNC